MGVDFCEATLTRKDAMIMPQTDLDIRHIYWRSLSFLTASCK